MKKFYSNFYIFIILITLSIIFNVASAEEHSGVQNAQDQAIAPLKKNLISP